VANASTDDKPHHEAVGLAFKKERRPSVLKILLPIFTVVAIMGQTAASARTMEQVAAAAGQLEGGHNRARFRCLAAGIPMPTFAQLHPDLDPATSADLKARYPDFFCLWRGQGRQASR